MNIFCFINQSFILCFAVEPVNVSIVSGGQSLSAGGLYELVCQAWGSRPAAAISWWKGGTHQLQDADISVGY